MNPPHLTPSPDVGEVTHLRSGGWVGCITPQQPLLQEWVGFLTQYPCSGSEFPFHNVIVIGLTGVGGVIPPYTLNIGWFGG